ncbi:MAG: hypothetical protein KatS3mg104_2541 [Phycisphaerae bacterium]|nr:MAG: hypothetical protein KatS3mg104_2541 [Phycisphaerae bacterium]
MQTPPAALVERSVPTAPSWYVKPMVQLQADTPAG